MRILITGADGYIGWPLTVSLLKNKRIKQIVCVDNLVRRKWLKEVKSNSAIKIASLKQKRDFIKNENKNNFFYNFDLNNYSKVNSIIKKYKFNTIINLAAQPSAPYSFLNISKCNFTQNNNNQILRNIIWSIKENKLQKKTKLIHSTTTGVYGSPKIKIPEGFIKISKENYPFGFMAGSWYHMSKCNDINNLFLAKKVFGIDAIDLRTAITIGLDYEGFELSNKTKVYNTRFDYDFFFGVVVNRFIAMALTNFNITLYGKGLQEKPFISLRDAVKSIKNLIIYPPKKGGVFNQMTKILSIKEISKKIQSNKSIRNLKIINIKNPRVENETHKMKMENKKFITILRDKPQKFKETIDNTIYILNYLNAKINKKKFLKKN